jgi:hypothetical protein
MGSGRFDEDLYRSSATHRAKTNTPTFAYSKTMDSTPVTARKAHIDLDPLGIKGVRESRDSDEHPESVPVAVLFDVTGSMHHIPELFQEKLPKLMTLLVTKGGLAHPHVLFGAIGDATCDSVPFQVGQFESDNRCDEQLRNIYLEKGGGGQETESYELAYYFAGWKTDLDSLNKRGKKGYLFTLGDERFYPKVSAAHIQKLFGDKLEKDLPIHEALAKAQEKFEVFHVHVQQGSYKDRASIIDAWRDLHGQHLLLMDDASLVCELIASTISLFEGADLHDATDGLGLDPAGVSKVGNALVKVAGSINRVGTAKGDLPATTEGAASRL